MTGGCPNQLMPIHYTDPDADVPPGVDFLDAEQVLTWVSACERGKPWRVPMRQHFAELLGKLPPGASVLELGSGPGYLAECPRTLSERGELHAF